MPLVPSVVFVVIALVVLALAVADTRRFVVRTGGRAQTPITFRAYTV